MARSELMVRRVRLVARQRGERSDADLVHDWLIVIHSQTPAGCRPEPDHGDRNFDSCGPEGCATIAADRSIEEEQWPIALKFREIWARRSGRRCRRLPWWTHGRIGPP